MILFFITSYSINIYVLNSSLPKFQILEIFKFQILKTLVWQNTGEMLYIY